MYITEPPSTVTALDVRTGRPLWTWSPTMPTDVRSPRLGRPVNRGVAVLDDTVYVGTDARPSGRARRQFGSRAVGHRSWTTTSSAYYLTLAPLAIDGRIIVGVSGAEAGIRGFVDAYDPKTGKRVWRTHTIPAPGEPGSNTWSGDALEDGRRLRPGSRARSIPELNLVYWGTGNPGTRLERRRAAGRQPLHLLPARADAGRPGKIKWHFQFTPHDTHDWDSNEIPVLVRRHRSTGGRASWSSMANRNGVLLRARSRPTASSWSARRTRSRPGPKGSTPKGRPIVKPGTEPSIEGTLVYPSIVGALELAQPLLQPADESLLPGASRSGHGLLQGRREVQAGRGFGGGGTRLLNGDVVWRRSGRSTPRPASSSGNSSCFRRRGRACCRRPAASCSVALRKATSSRSTPRRESGSGTSSSARAVRGGQPMSVRARRQAVRRHRRGFRLLRVRSALAERRGYGRDTTSLAAGLDGTDADGAVWGTPINFCNSATFPGRYGSPSRVFRPCATSRGRCPRLFRAWRSPPRSTRKRMISAPRPGATPSPRFR